MIDFATRSDATDHSFERTLIKVLRQTLVENAKVSHRACSALRCDCSIAE